jgi:hypothetical protein
LTEDDRFYTVAVQAGSVQTAVNLGTRSVNITYYDIINVGTRSTDTGSSDLWIMSDACQTAACKASSAAAYKASSGQPTGASVNLQYGDSTSGSHAIGPVVMDTVAVAGLSLPNQPFGAINDTDNSAVQNGGAGIFGLGFPSQR